MYVCVRVCAFIMPASLIFAAAYQKYTPIVFQCLLFVAAAAGEGNDGGDGEQWWAVVVTISGDWIECDTNRRTQSRWTHIHSAASSALALFLSRGLIKLTKEKHNNNSKVTRVRLAQNDCE